MSIELNWSVRALVFAAVVVIAGCGDEKPATSRPKDSAAASTSKDSSEEAPVAGTKPAGGFDTGKPVVDSTARYGFALRPKKGDAFAYRMRTDNVTAIGGKKMTEVTVYNFTITVTGLNDDGSLTVDMTHDSIRVKRSYDAGLVDSVARTIAFDTRKADTSMRGTEQYRALIGKRVNLTLSKDGDVREVSNVDPVVNAIFGKVRDKIPPKQWGQFRELVKVQAYSGIISQIFLKEAPDSAVAPGRQWTRTYEVPAMGIPSRNSVSYKLAEVREVNGRHLGRVVMKLTTKFLQNKVDNELVTATIDEMKADGEAEAVIQLDNGFPVRKVSSIEMSMKMTGTLKDGPEKGKSDTLEQAIATRLTLELVNFTAGS
ncbi:MAG: hypothetical protein H7X80_05845 [bacterium]|nr:hypothetical protein [Candidatus Kapabacteria bacterium]